MKKYSDTLSGDLKRLRDAVDKFGDSIDVSKLLLTITWVYFILFVSFILFIVTGE